MNFETAFFLFTNVYPIFLAELIVAEILFVFKLKRKDYFIARLIPGVIMLPAVTLILCFLQTVIPQNPLTGALPYLALFVFTVVILKMCFDEPFKILLLCGAAAYACQNAIYRVVTLFENTGVVWRFSEKIGNYSAAYWIVLIPVLALSYVAVYFLFAKRINEKGVKNIYSRNVLFVTLCTMIVTVILCSYANAWGWQHWQLSVVNSCFNLISDVFILAMLSGIFENVGLRGDIEIIRQLWLQDKRQYEISKENIDLINIRCHDLKHKIRSLKDAESADELKEVELAAAIYDSKVTTGCDPLDVLISEKSLICLKRNIKLTCMADGEALAYMSESELYSLFGNILSNAMEAVSALDEEDRRVIDLTVTRVAGMVMINCVNYFDGGLTLKDGVPQTTKQDKTSHGFGIKSMQMLVKKYGGEIYFTAKDGVFDLKIMLPESVKKPPRARAAQ